MYALVSSIPLAVILAIALNETRSTLAQACR